MGISLEQKCTVTERWSAYIELGAVYERFELDTTEGMLKLTLTHQFCLLVLDASLHRGSGSKSE